MATVSAVQIARITLAAEDVDRIVAFYDAVLSTGLKKSGDGPFWRGTLAGIPLVICPNSIAEVDARQNRHQLRLAVADPGALLAAAAASGGEVIQQWDESSGLGAFRDPEGNSYDVCATG